MRRVASLMGVLLVVAGCGGGGKTGTPGGAVSGTEGGVRYAAEAEGKQGAHARFTLGSATKTTADDAVVEVHVSDHAHAALTFRGVTLDGEGALSSKESATLRALEATGAVEDLALIPLQLGCTKDVEPRVLAALLFPWQLVQKYLVADREAQTLAFAQKASCRYYTKPGSDDARPSPHYPLLSNGQFVARSFGYLPLDDKGELAAAAQKKLEPADQNVYGTGNSMCRGACGADCEENNCGQPKETWRCVQNDGKNTGDKELWQIYTCGEHPGCIEHDDCYDNCKAVFGVDSWDTGFCMRGCDLQAATGYGAGQGLEWAQGYGPYTQEKTYEYSTGERILDEKTCPLDFGLTVVPSSGLAPFATTIKWTGELHDTGTERCRLDLGDGSPLVDIEPCTANGQYDHIYSVPSEMRKASGIYTVTLTRIGAAQMATAEVQARWRFEATPDMGEPPLLTAFSWTGFDFVEKPLTCTLNYGDGSAPEVIENCAKKPGTTHTYAKEGTYVASLKVKGEDRPVVETATVVVKKKDTRPQNIGGVRTWRFDYSIENDSDYNWSESGVDTVRNWTERESGSITLTRTSYGLDEVEMNGEGAVTSSWDFKRVDSSPYFREERWDKGTGPSTVQVMATLNLKTGMYDVYITTGDFAAQYGGSRTQSNGDNSSYGPSDEQIHVQPAPIIPNGELTRTLPTSGDIITGSYTWEDFYAYQQAQDPSYDVTEEWKVNQKSGTTKWTLTPLTYD